MATAIREPAEQGGTAPSRRRSTPGTTGADRLHRPEAARRSVSLKERSSIMTDEQNPRPQAYQIHASGRLDARWSERLGGLSATSGGPDGRETILSNPVVDPATLHGLLIKICDPGVPLLTVLPCELGLNSASTQANASVNDTADRSV
jgi:hypothetical protein